MKITELTEAQWAQVHAARERWLARGLSTEPADRPATEAAIRSMYTELGAEEPRIFWLASPMSCVLGAPVIAATLGGTDDQLNAQLSAKLSAKLHAQLRHQISTQLSDQLNAQLSAKLHAQLISQLSSQLDNQLNAQISSQLISQLSSQLDNQLNAQISSQLLALAKKAWATRWSTLWQAWRMHCATCRDVCGVQYSDDVNSALERWLALDCSWMFVFSNFVVCAERPAEIRRDPEGRLHCETGPALRYRDGYSLYSWRGTTIPAEWIENKEALDPKTALTWENVEQRRCAAEIIGWDKSLNELNTTVVDTDPDPEIGTLLRVGD